MDIIDLNIKELSESYAAKEVSPVEAAKAYLEAIDRLNPDLGAYLTLCPELALAQAAEAEKRIRHGQARPMTGVPLALKDLLCTKGVRTTCASKILRDFVPPYDATVVARLRDQGAVFLGKVNMDEFAMGSSNEHSAFGPAKNPWNTLHVPGGSSGGSAVATAARLAAAALGSDTGGSIRQPASHCGVVGLKPTYGRVSRFGLVAFASSLDQIGPFARTTQDCAMLLEAIAGYDPRDSTSMNVPVPSYTRALKEELSGFTIGLPRQYFAEGLNQEVEKAVRAGVKLLEDAGAKTVEVDLPHTEYAVAAYYIIAPAEASSNLARYDGIKYTVRAEGAKDLMDVYLKTRSEGFGPEVKRRIMIGTYVLSAGYYDAYYKKGTQVRALIRQDFERAFERCDVIASPVAPTPAFKMGEKTADPLTMYLSDAYTIATNLAGIPGLSIPCGMSSEGLPIGMQLMASHFNEEKLFAAAHAHELRSNFSFGKILPRL